MHASPRDSLLAGVTILAPILKPPGFTFEFRGDGQGSGGYFAWGEFVGPNRKLELHYRQSLGDVTYHAAGNKVTHEGYMRELGVWNRCRYPGFSSEHQSGFHDLAHDLEFAQDFLAGDAKFLLAASARESVAHREHSERLTASYAGDTRTLQEMRTLFKSERYAGVLSLFDKLHSPHLLSDAQLRFVQLARQRVNG